MRKEERKSEFFRRGRKTKEEEETKKIKKIKKTHRRKPSQQVQRGRALVVGLDEPPGVGHSRLLGRLGPVDDVAAVRREQAPVGLLFQIGRTRFGELPCHPPDFHDGDSPAEHGYDGHLEQHAEGVSDAVGGEVTERLGAVAAWKCFEGFCVCVCVFGCFIVSAVSYSWSPRVSPSLV